MPRNVIPATASPRHPLQGLTRREPAPAPPDERFGEVLDAVREQGASVAAMMAEVMAKLRAPPVAPPTPGPAPKPPSRRPISFTVDRSGGVLRLIPSYGYGSGQPVRFEVHKDQAGQTERVTPIY